MCEHTNDGCLYIGIYTYSKCVFKFSIQKSFVGCNEFCNANQKRNSLRVFHLHSDCLQHTTWRIVGSVRENSTYLMGNHNENRQKGTTGWREKRLNRIQSLSRHQPKYNNTGLLSNPLASSSASQWFFVALLRIILLRVIFFILSTVHQPNEIQPNKISIYIRSYEATPRVFHKDRLFLPRNWRRGQYCIERWAKLILCFDNYPLFLHISWFFSFIFLIFNVVLMSIQQLYLW